MKNILLASITEGDSCVAPFSLSLAHSVREGLKNNIYLEPLFVEANGNYGMAFNRALTISWEQEFDGVVFIHPFVSWKAEDLIQFLQTEKDALAMPVATKNGFEVNLGEISRIEEDIDTYEIKVKGASLDFLYLSKYSIDTLCKAHPTVTHLNAEIKLVLQTGDIYQTFYHPAEIVAYRLREVGIETWLHSKMTAHKYQTIRYAATFPKVFEDLKNE